ncbi:protein CutA homolog [Polyodon spathula]|uniref:protein CutA homolog n=1 Tax=Polyodon spathula TaxID=7913 RepID=UPI001B7DB861|nr:protein CutA homolog [Polyodon spathula]
MTDCLMLMLVLPLCLDPFRSVLGSLCTLQGRKQNLETGIHFIAPQKHLQVKSTTALLLSVVVYPVLKTVSLQLHSAFTGSYISGFNSIAFISCPNEQVAMDIARAVMEKRLAAGVNILPKSSSMYYWKGKIEEATEIPLLIKTRTSSIPELSEYVRYVHF